MAKVVLVTGTSSGIGEAIALQQARAGNTVFATMRTPDTSGDGLRAAAATGLDIRVLQLDVTNDESVTNAIHEALAQTGRIDVLVNNAGISPIGCVEGSLEEAKHAFDTNYFGMLRTIAAVLPSMRQQGSGVIVNVSSVTGVLANAGSGSYAASKHAVEAMSESLAIETMSHGIRVIILQPGFIATRIFEKAQRGAPPSGPYETHVRRMRAMYTDPQNIAQPPSVVAEALQAALDDPEPKLRYKAGSAKIYIEGRRRLSDEQWIGTGRFLDDAEWFVETRKMFVVDAKG